MPAKIVQCRWGILGCGAEAAHFVADIQSEKATNTASTSGSPIVQHSITAISSGSSRDSRAFADAHVYTTGSVEAFGTSTELHAHPAIDAVFIACPQAKRYQEATSALRGGKATLLHKPLSMTSSEALELCTLAKREGNMWLGLVMRKQKDEQGLRWAADECALGIADATAESSKLPWSQALGILEALDDLRVSGDLQSMDSSMDFKDSTSAQTTSSSPLSVPMEQQKIIVATGQGQRFPRIAKGRNSLPANRGGALPLRLAGSNGTRPRTSSVDRPFADVVNTADVDLTGGRRRRKDPSPTHSPVSGQLNLQMVPEHNRRNSNSLGLSEGFLSPTIASESRRLATSAGLGSPVSSGPSAFSLLNGTPTSTTGKGTSKVIEQLTTDLHAARMTVEDTRTQLRVSQQTVTTLQRRIDELSETLNRSRAENETSGQMLARKDRQHQEVLERARKAEVQARELGKSSREWGTRLRKIEAELGEERMAKQRAEMQYDAIAASWKQTREAWEKEMNELRSMHGSTAKRNRDRLHEIQQQYQKRDEHGEMLSAAVAELKQERAKAASAVLGPVRELMEQLERHEVHTSSQDTSVREVQDELKRILRLMRSPLPSTVT